MKRNCDVHIYILPIYVIKLVTASVHGIVRLYFKANPQLILWIAKCYIFRTKAWPIRRVNIIFCSLSFKGKLEYTFIQWQTNRQVSAVPKATCIYVTSLKMKQLQSLAIKINITALSTLGVHNHECDAERLPWDVVFRHFFTLTFLNRLLKTRN